MREVVIIGCGGHGKVIADIIEKSGDKVLGFIDDNPRADKVFGYPVLGKTDAIKHYIDKEFFIAIGNNEVRKKIAVAYNLKYYTAIHPRASIAKDVTIGAGSCVMAGVVINPSVKIGNHCIINSGSVVDHDNNLADYVHLSPGAVLCGTVSVGSCTHIGAGAVVRNNTSVCDECIIGVGAAVVKNIDKKGTYIGVPARLKEEK